MLQLWNGLPWLLKSLLFTFNVKNLWHKFSWTTVLPKITVWRNKNHFQILILSCFPFVYYLSPFLLTRNCHLLFSTPLIIVLSAPVAVMPQNFLRAMGFVSALWSWQREGLVYACWSALFPNHHARSLNSFFAIRKQRLQSPHSFLLASSVWNTESM